MLRPLKHLLLAEDGQDLVEYALLAALIAMASIVALRELGPVISGFYGSLVPYLEL
jgi:Flp pilus assembly pilin Flp